MLITYIIAAVVTLLGLRLIALGTARRSAPESVLGFAIFLIQPGSVLLGYALQRPAPELIQVSLACVSAGTAAMAGFTQLTFRAHDVSARWILAALIVFLVYAHLLQAPLFLATGEPHLAYLGARVLLLGWSAYTALRHRALYLRRARIGLVNPVVANRFLLFGVWISSMAINSATTILVVLVGPRFGIVDWRLWVFGVARVISVILLLATWLMFFPPHRYLRWVERRYAERSRPIEALT